MKIIAALLPVIALAACNSQPTAENVAERLENGANESTPEAAEILNDAAQDIRSGEMEGSMVDPHGSVQNAMENAANAQSPGNNSVR